MADSKKRSGGPKTHNGKASPSQNATKHGRTGKTLILSGESHEEFDALRAGRLKEFEPEGYQEERLVEILILNDWWLKRVCVAKTLLMCEINGLHWDPDVAEAIAAVCYS